MTKKVLYLDEQIFITAFGQAVADGNEVFVRQHRPRLDALVARMTDCLQELSDLQYRSSSLAVEKKMAS